MEPGFMMSVGATWRAVENDGGIPFVDVSAATAFMVTRTIRASHDETYAAIDIRAGATVGWTLGEVFSPYLGLRAFGGPILWRVDGEDVHGTDKWHFQVPVGATLALPAGLSIFFDWSPVGERAIWAGAGAAW